MEKFQVRTDLALEEREKVQGSEIPGIRVREWEKEETGIRVTEVAVCDERGEKALGKPVGMYLTVEAASLEAAVLVDSAVDSAAEEAVAVLPHAARDSAIKAAVASASCFFIIILLHLLYHKLLKVAHHRCAALFHNLRIHNSIFSVNVHNQHVLPCFLVHFSQPVTLL